MNIFKILTRGDGKINEPSVTAFMGYLLNPNEDHGLDDEFLKLLLNALIDDNNKSFYKEIIDGEEIRDLASIFTVDVRVERKLPFKKTSRDIDIVIEIKGITPENDKSIHVIAIENKIRDASSEALQLQEQSAALVDFYKDGSYLPRISQVYLTPDGQKSIDNFNNSKQKINSGIELKHIRWKSESGNILSLLKKLLELESMGNVEPIGDYMKCTLKAFINFINTDFRSSINHKNSTGRMLLTEKEFFETHEIIEKFHNQVMNEFSISKLKFTGLRVTYHSNTITNKTQFFALYHEPRKDKYNRYILRLYADYNENYNGEEFKPDNKILRIEITNIEDNVETVLKILRRNVKYLADLRD